MQTNANEEIEIDLLEVFYLLRSKLWIIIISGVVLASAGGLVSNFLITPMYSSKTQLYILSKSTSLTSLADIQIGTQLTQDYMVLVKSRPVVTKVIENLQLDMSYEDMAESIEISNPSNTRILEIKIEYPDAFLAKKIVDEFANVSTEQIAKIMDTEKPTIVEEGFISQWPSGPNVKKNIIISGLIGIFLAAGVIVLLYILDDTIKDSGDIEKYLGLSTLGLIPIENNKTNEVILDKKKRKKAKMAEKKGKR